MLELLTRVPCSFYSGIDSMDRHWITGHPWMFIHPSQDQCRTWSAARRGTRDCSVTGTDVWLIVFFGGYESCYIITYEGYHMLSPWFPSGDLTWPLNITHLPEVATRNWDKLAEVFYELGRQRMLDKGRWGPTIFRDLRHDLRHMDKSQ